MTHNQVRPTPSPARTAPRVCMHVLGPALTDGRVMRSATALAQAGYAVTIVDIEHGVNLPTCEDSQGVHLRHVRFALAQMRHYHPTHHLAWLLFKVRRIVRGTLAVLRTPAEVYHAHDITALPACYMAAKLRRKLLIFDAHELPLVDPHVQRLRLITGLATRMLRLMLRSCAGIITVSPPLVRELQRRYGGPLAVLVRNIHTYEAPPPTNHLRDYLNLGSDVRIALYQGFLQADRGLDILVRVAQHLTSSTHIVLLGKGPAAVAITAQIAELGVGDRITIVPAVPYADLLAWTASADIGLTIYQAEYSANVQVYLPNKLFEYLMAGLPVVASAIEAVAEIVQTYDVGIIEPALEPAAVAQAIDRLLDDQPARSRMRSNALRAARDSLCWEQESVQLIDLYRAIVGTV